MNLYACAYVSTCAQPWTHVPSGFFLCSLFFLLSFKFALRKQPPFSVFIDQLYTEMIFASESSRISRGLWNLWGAEISFSHFPMFSHVCFLLWLRIAQQGSRTRSWVYFWGTSWNGEGEEPTYIQNDDDDEEEPEAVFRRPLLSAAHPQEGADCSTLSIPCWCSALSWCMNNGARLPWNKMLETVHWKQGLLSSQPLLSHQWQEPAQRALIQLERSDDFFFQSWPLSLLIETFFPYNIF